MKILILTLLTVPLIASAQVRKCQGPDGKIVYSDVVCTDTRAKESSVNINGNAIDHSWLRAQGRRMRESDAQAQLAANPPSQCRFQSDKGDSKGANLSQLATQECISNILAEKDTSQQRSTAAYEQWKDHFTQSAANRNAADARADAKSNTDRIIKAQKASTLELGMKIDEAGRKAARGKF